ncbi:hypothetical protein [Anianabacter salinae]|uniref:hypothetical protein n=1 Tax=Anianabacter salinae TaxID=2851023 RepID=UPI00225E0E31|nr:hypothetical protein [Anianabacter salinae]MBV0913316.1 hypothetical protein [Anianabacter salinae]
MAGLTLTKTRLAAGRWEGVLDADDRVTGMPRIEVTHLDEPVEGVTMTPDPRNDGRWFVTVTVPPEAITDGVQTILMSEPETGERLGSFTIIAGDPLDDDLRAEIDLLRAELDMLKAAFRRHCVETAG